MIALIKGMGPASFVQRMEILTIFIALLQV